VRWWRRNATDRTVPAYEVPSHPGFHRITISPDHVAILRERFFGGLEGALLDLQTPSGLRDPVATAREATVYARLLEGLDRRWIELPDEEARARMVSIARGFDEADEYERAARTHDAHWAMVELLGGVSRRQ
jgi:hypothetical protein